METEADKVEDSNKIKNVYFFFHEELHFANNWKISSRIKFNHVDVVQVCGQSFTAIGTNNGSVYLFERVVDELKHITTLKKEEAPVTKLKFNVSGSHLACALRNGTLIIYSIKFLLHHFECVRTSQLHKDSVITGLAWMDDATLYSGDDKGFVSVTFAPATKSLDIMSLPSAPVQNLKSPIVQMDACRSLICVSTEKAAFLFDSEARTFRTVGSKSRQGKFGAAFAPEWDGHLKLYSARPGYRLWQTEGDNVVSVTHQYKEFSGMDPPRIWGQPIAAKVNNSRSGVFSHLFSIEPNILVCVDMNNNFCFIDRVTKLAKAWLPSPEDLLSFSSTPSGQIYFLLTGNRIFSSSYSSLNTTINQLISSSWISEAVELIISLGDSNHVTENLSEVTLSSLLEAAGEGDAHYETLLALRNVVREKNEVLTAKAEAEDFYPEVTHVRSSNGMDEVDLDDASSEISERSWTSSLDSQELEARGARRRSSDLLTKMRTRIKVTSNRFRQEITSSEKAQTLVKMVRDTTTKIKTDAEHFIVDKVNLMPSVVPSELETSHDFFDQNTTKKSAEVYRKISSRGSNYLNFVELEAAANICWERWWTRTDRLSDADVCQLRVRKSIEEFISVVSRLMTLYHDSVNAKAILAGPDEELMEDDGPQADAATMTVGTELWNDFPMPAKLQDLCGRIAVLSIFTLLSERRDGELSDAIVDNDKSTQTMSTSGASGPRMMTHENEVAMASLEPIFDQLHMYEDYGFVEQAFLDLTQVVKIDVGFWRRCLQQFPTSTEAFSQHIAAVAETLKDRFVKLDLFDWSSVEVFHVLETSLVTEPLIAFQMLLKLMEVQPQQALRFAVQNSNHVTLRDVFNILLRQQQIHLLFDYVLLLMEDSHISQLTDRLRYNDDIFISIIVVSAIWENDEIPEQRCRSCEERIFLPSDMKSQRKVTSFLFKSCGSVRAMDVSEKWLLQNGFVVQYSEALKAQEKWEELIKIAFTLDRSDLVLNLERLTTEHIRLITDLMIKAKPPSCINCGAAKAKSLTAWTWSLVGRLISQSLAAPNAVQLLSDIDIPDSAELRSLFQTFSLNSLNAANVKKVQEDVTTDPAKSLLSQCHRAWGKPVSEVSECFLCGRLVFDGAQGEILEIMPCCRNVFHRDCLPCREFCVICLK